MAENVWRVGDHEDPCTDHAERIQIHFDRIFDFNIA